MLSLLWADTYSNLSRASLFYLVYVVEKSEMKGPCRDRASRQRCPVGLCNHFQGPNVHACTAPCRILFHSPPSPLAPKLLHSTGPDKQYIRMFRSLWRIVEAQRPILPGCKTNMVQHYLRFPESLQGAATRSPQIHNESGTIARLTLGNKRPLFVNQTALPRNLWTVIIVHQAFTSAQD